MLNLLHLLALNDLQCLVLPHGGAVGTLMLLSCSRPSGVNSPARSVIVQVLTTLLDMKNNFDVSCSFLSFC